MKRIKYFIPSILIMIIIFSFSNQTGTQSSGLSSNIVLLIQNILHISIPEIIIRKIAHMSEYALLTITLIYGFYHTVKTSQIIPFSLLTCFLYACSDELHQLFIGGRAGQFSDVMIDICGAILACLIYSMLKRYKS